MTMLFVRRVSVSLLTTAGVLISLLGFGGISQAQGRAEGSIVGTVTDESRAVIPGVTVTATDPATSFSRVSVTGTNGEYRLSALPPGTYEITFDLAGFQTRRAVRTVTVGADSTLDTVMVVGTLEESVSVTAEQPLVEVTKTEQAVTFSSKEIGNLPTNSRNFLDFALLSPGVVRGRSSGAGWGGEGGASSSGNRGDQNAINIDGIVNKSLDNGTDQGNFSQEGVQEFQIITQGYPAEFGGSSGAVINAVTKSGTNTTTGYAYYFLRDDAFDKPPFDIVTRDDGTKEAEPSSDADEFRRQVLGLTLGGPLVRNKLFYFGLLERIQSNTPQVRSIAPSTIELVKQLGIALTPDNESNKVTQFEPRHTRTALKVDWNTSPEHRSTGRFSYTKSFSPAGTANGLNSVMNAQEARFTNLTIGYILTSVLSSSRLNTLRLQYYHDNNYNDPVAYGGEQNRANFPAQIAIGGGSGGTFGRSNGGSIGRAEEKKYELQDTFTIYLNNHQFKVGGQFLHAPFFQVNQHSSDGLWRFSDINAFIAGRPSTYQRAWGQFGSFMRVNYFAAFAQDEWQLTDGLTLNFGVRYQVDKYPDEISRYELPEVTYNSATEEFTKEAGSPNMGGYKSDLNNFSPRLGIAFTPDGGKTMIRAAGGAFYGNNYLGEMGNGMSWDGFPASQRYTFTSAQAREMWSGIVTPGSPYYNPNGATTRSLSGAYFLNHLLDAPFTRTPFDPATMPPRSVQANVGIERQVTDALALSATYLWSRGWDNVRSVNTNPGAPTFYSAGSRLPSGTITPFDLHFFGGPRPDPRFGDVLVYGNFGNVWYNGLTVAASIRWPHLTGKISYTYNGAVDDSVAISFLQGPSDLVCGVRCEKSDSVLKVQRVVGSLVFATPSSWPAWARDLQIAGTFERESGHPFQVVAGFDFSNDTVPSDRPYGVPRNALITDPYFNVDLRLSRIIPIKGKFKAEIMFELFNLLNTAHYSNYDGNLYRLQSGVYVPRPDFAAFAAGPELNVLRLDRDPKSIDLDPALRRTGVGDPLQGQLGFRIHF